MAVILLPLPRSCRMRPPRAGTCNTRCSLHEIFMGVSYDRRERTAGRHSHPAISRSRGHPKKNVHFPWEHFGRPGDYPAKQKQGRPFV
jgi:hypothetical protein